MEEHNMGYIFRTLSIDVDYYLEHDLEYEWIEFSWNKYTESFLCPNNDIEYYDDIEFLCLYKNDDNDDDDDVFFDLLCEEVDEIFSQYQ